MFRIDSVLRGLFPQTKSVTCSVNIHQLNYFSHLPVCDANYMAFPPLNTPYMVPYFEFFLVSVFHFCWLTTLPHLLIFDANYLAFPRSSPLKYPVHGPVFWIFSCPCISLLLSNKSGANIFGYKSGSEIFFGTNKILCLKGSENLLGKKNLW